MNASVNLLVRAGRSTVHIEATVPASHPSTQILGTGRLGSGTVVDPRGLILTVSYIVLGAQTIKVTIQDGREFIATIAALDSISGLAILRLAGEKLPALSLRSSEPVKLGDDVFVISSVGPRSSRVANGNVTSLAPFDANWEYTLDRAIMTSTVNPGLGGGALVDRFGTVIGIVSLSMSTIGRLSLAVPSECFLDHRDELLRHGRRVAVPPRAWLGVFCYSLQGRVVIAGMFTGAPAERAGIKQGDVVLSIDGREVADRWTLYHQLWTHKAGEAVELEVFRDDGRLRIYVPTTDVEDFFA